MANDTKEEEEVKVTVLVVLVAALRT